VNRFLAACFALGVCSAVLVAQQSLALAAEPTPSELALRKLLGEGTPTPIPHLARSAAEVLGERSAGNRGRECPHPPGFGPHAQRLPFAVREGDRQGDHRLRGRWLWRARLENARRLRGRLLRAARGRRDRPQVSPAAAPSGSTTRAFRRLRCSMPNGPCDWSASGPRNGTLIPTRSASSATRRAPIWR
jgi:hypothetical protein